jgi:Flp pilus assembly pilin Flp
MRNALLRFRRSEEGAVTVEFVVVVAGIVGLSIATMATLADGVIDSASSLGTALESDVSISYTPQTD